MLIETFFPNITGTFTCFILFKSVNLQVHHQVSVLQLLGGNIQCIEIQLATAFYTIVSSPHSLGQCLAGPLYRSVSNHGMAWLLLDCWGKLDSRFSKLRSPDCAFGPKSGRFSMPPY